MGCGLRKEIEDMLQLIPEKNWALCLSKREAIFRRRFLYRITKPNDFLGWLRCPVWGEGATKAAALRNLLANWRAGKICDSFPRAPAMSSGELQLKLAIYGKEKGK